MATGKSLWMKLTFEEDPEMLRILTGDKGKNCTSFKFDMKSKFGTWQLFESFHQHFKTISEIFSLVHSSM